MLYIGKNLETKEAAYKYNQDLYEYRSKAFKDGYSAGCIGTLACEHCYHLISDTICLCCGIFICPNCNYQNGQEAIKWIEESKKLTTFNNVQPFWTDGIVYANQTLTTFK